VILPLLTPSLSLQIAFNKPQYSHVDPIVHMSRTARSATADAISKSYSMFIEQSAERSAVTAEESFDRSVVQSVNKVAGSGMLKSKL
jgi:hypothetical protein